GCRGRARAPRRTAATAPDGGASARARADHRRGVRSHRGRGARAARKGGGGHMTDVNDGSGENQPLESVMQAAKVAAACAAVGAAAAAAQALRSRHEHDEPDEEEAPRDEQPEPEAEAAPDEEPEEEQQQEEEQKIGRASCRERVKNAGVAGAVKKKKKN